MNGAKCDADDEQDHDATGRNRKSRKRLSSSSSRQGEAEAGSEAAATSAASLKQCRKWLGDAFPGRIKEIEELLSVLGEPGDAFPTTLVYGGAATGKTSVVRGAMALLRRPFSYVSCRSCHNARLMFEAVLNQLLGHVRCKGNSYRSAKKCDKLADFIALLGDSCAAASSSSSSISGNGRDSNGSEGGRGGGEQQMVYLIFDEVEVLRGWAGGPALLSSLSSLSRLTHLTNLGLIFISNAGPDTLFQGGTTSRELLSLYFRDYTNEETLSILAKWRPNSDLYSFFLRSSLAPFCRASRRLTELSDCVHPLFEKFCEPVLQGNRKTRDQGRHELFTYMKRHLQSAISQTFSITDAVHSTSRANVTAAAASPGRYDERLSGNACKIPTPDYHLSLCSKYLLLASYIASRNPSTLDDTVFGTGEGSQPARRKRRRSSSARDKKEADMHEKHLKRPCPLERLLAIYRCLVVENGSVLEDSSDGHYLVSRREEEKVESVNDVTADVLMQLSSLGRANLVLRSSSSALDGVPRFLCNVDSDFATNVARSIHFPLSKYLLHG